MARISIRNRLLIIVILINLSLIFQNNIIDSTNEAVQSLEIQSQEFILRDNALFNDLSNLEKSSETLVQIQLNKYFDSIFNYEASTSAIEKDEYLLSLASVTQAFTDRNIKRYTFEIGEISNFIISETDRHNLNELNQGIIDTGETGIYSKLQALEGFLLTTMNNFVEETDLAKGQFLNATSNYFTLSSSVDSNVQEVENIFDIYSTSLNGANNTYFRTLSEIFNPVFSNYSILMSQYVVLTNSFISLNSGAGVANFSIAVDKFHEELLVITSNLGNDFGAVNLNNLDLPEQNIIGSIESTLLDNFAGLVVNLNSSLNLLEITRSSILALDEARSIRFDRILDLVSTQVDTTTTILRNEINLFTSEFIAFKVGYDNSIQSRNAILNYGLAGIVTLVSLITAFSLTVNLTRLTNKQKQISSGDISFTSRSRYSNDEIGDVERGFDEMASFLKSAIEGIKIVGDRLAGISEMLAAGAQEASASMSAVSITMGAISDGATRQNNLITKVNDSLQDHRKEIRNASLNIAEASRIVLKVAQRSNTLSLNASIEAAKAGASGKGFGIVANQVRLLANEAKKSANEISNHINDINQNISRTIIVMLEEVDIVRELAESTASGSSEANASTSEQVLMMSEISTTSNELSDLANQLGNLLEEFTVVKM